MSNQKKRLPAKKSKHEVLVEKEELIIIPSNDYNPATLLAMGIQSNIDLNRLEKLIELQERWEANKARKEYFAAFGKFQSMRPDLVKNKQVDYPLKNTQPGEPSRMNYKYQELGDIAKHIQEPLAQCGLSYRWDQVEEGDNIIVTCIVSHTSGHQEKGQPLSGKADDSGKKNSIQKKASTITYLRRYTLTGMLGLSSSEADNDGLGGAADDNIPSTTLPFLKEESFMPTMKMVQEGKWTIEYVKTVFALTSIQEAALTNAQPKK